jgi:hypothetical protein
MQRNKEFKVSAPGLPTDTVIGYFLGGFSALFVVLAIVKSIVTQGKVQRVYGVLMVSALIMAFTGLIFSILGYRADMGGITTKKIAIMLNVVVLAVTAIFLVMGL